MSIQGIANEVYWSVFHRLDAIKNFDGGDAGRIATKVEEMVRNELANLPAQEPLPDAIQKIWEGKA